MIVSHHRTCTVVTSAALSVIALIGVCPASGSPLTLDELTAAAVERSPSVRDRTAAVAIANGHFVTASAWVPANPTLAYEWTSDRFNANQGEGGSALLLEQPVEIWGQRAARVAEARALNDAAVLDLDFTRFDVAEIVKRDYFRVLVLNDKLRILADLRSLAVRSSASAKQKLSAGLVSAVNAQIATFEALGIENDERSAVGERDTVLAELRQLTGLADLTAADLQGRPVVGSWDANVDELVDRAIAQRPDLAALRRQNEARKSAVTALRRSRFPDVAFRAGYLRNQSVVDGSNVSYLAGATPSIARIADSDSLVTLGASITLPVFRRNAGAIASALGEQDRARALLSAEEGRVRADVSRLVERIRGRSAVLAGMESSLPGLAAGLEDVTRAYTLGEYSIDRYLVEKDRLSRALLSHEDVLLDTLEAFVELERTVGVSLYQPEIAEIGVTQ